MSPGSSRSRSARLVTALLGVLLLGTAAVAEPPKKDRERAGKSTVHASPTKAGTKPRRIINLSNTWTDEWLPVDPSAPPKGAIVDRFLRDHYTNAPTPMGAHLIEFVVAAAEHFKRDTVFVVSAFRHPKYNLILRKKGHQVARDSHHSKGTAIDFFLPKVSTQKLHAWALDQKKGGVGLYLDSGFIHMDNGPVRRWSGE